MSGKDIDREARNAHRRLTKVSTRYMKKMRKLAISGGFCYSCFSGKVQRKVILGNTRCEICKEKARKYQSETMFSIDVLFCQGKSQAKTNGRAWDLTKEQFEVTRAKPT